MVTRGCSGRAQLALKNRSISFPSTTRSRAAPLQVSPTGPAEQRQHGSDRSCDTRDPGALHESQQKGDLGDAFREDHLSQQSPYLELLGELPGRNSPNSVSRLNCRFHELRTPRAAATSQMVLVSFGASVGSPVVAAQIQRSPRSRATGQLPCPHRAADPHRHSRGPHDMWLLLREGEAGRGGQGLLQVKQFGVEERPARVLHRRPAKLPAVRGRDESPARGQEALQPRHGWEWFTGAHLDLREWFQPFGARPGPPHRACDGVTAAVVRSQSPAVRQPVGGPGHEGG